MAGPLRRFFNIQDRMVLLINNQKHHLGYNNLYNILLGVTPKKLEIRVALRGETTHILHGKEGTLRIYHIIIGELAFNL